MSVAFKFAATTEAPAPVAATSLLRFITCGSVDDGKSTLIGRLLYEAKAVPQDTLQAMIADSARLGAAGGALDYSLLVDGLAAEREQGITIDVAWRYFQTARRSFIVADTPGHEYTRNMATGASNAEAALILIDARKGVLAQTRRHSLICSLVGVRHVIACINKIDLVGYDKARIEAIERDYRAAIAGLGFASVAVIPVSAREGDNILAPSPRTPWRGGPALLELLETIDAAPAHGAGDFAMPVQWVNRPDVSFRGFAGAISAGVIRPGEAVVALPSGKRAVVERIVTFDGDLKEALEGQAVTLTLDREIDLARGDVLVAARRPADPAIIAREEATVRLLATADRTIRRGDGFIARIGAASVNARIEEIVHAIDVDSFVERDAQTLRMNDLALVRLRFEAPVVAAPYATSRDLGSLILIDRISNATAAMGVVVEAQPRRVAPLRKAADSVFSRALGAGWRVEIGPAASWRIASAALFGLVVLALTRSFSAGLIAAACDVTLRPVLRFLHRGFWRKLRAKREGPGLVSDGEGI